MWGRRQAKKEDAERLRRQVEWALQKEAKRMREEMNLRLICDFCGSLCREEDREELLQFTRETGNFPLWRELNLPGDVLQVESFDIGEIVWQSPPPMLKKTSKKWGYAASLWRRFARLRDIMRRKADSKKHNKR